MVSGIFLKNLLNFNKKKQKFRCFRLRWLAGLAIEPVAGFTCPCLSKAIMRSIATAILLIFAVVASAETPAAAPADFVMQTLEPTGGKIKRPKEWLYNEDHHGPSYTWIISREDAAKGRYTTGMRIQLLAGVKAGTGKSPKDFVLDFIAAKKKSATKVVKACDPSQQELFTRICLETEEGGNHILYSAFWGNDNLDIVVICTSGTTKELWDTYSTTFDTMKDFELIDMKRFDKPSATFVIP